MSELRINRESFDETVEALKAVLSTLENYDRIYFEKLSDMVRSSNSEFTREYINSLELVKNEWDKNLVKQIINMINYCNEASLIFDNVDVTISTTINKGGSF